MSRSLALAIAIGLVASVASAQDAAPAPAKGAPAAAAEAPAAAEAGPAAIPDDVEAQVPGKPTPSEQRAAALASAAPKGDKVLSGMSIVGNDEAPKSLVIVPWKSSGLGDTLNVSRMLDDGRQPVDKEVFLRELTYYEIQAGSH